MLFKPSTLITRVGKIGIGPHATTKQMDSIEVATTNSSRRPIDKAVDSVPLAVQALTTGKRDLKMS